MKCLLVRQKVLKLKHKHIMTLVVRKFVGILNFRSVKNSFKPLDLQYVGMFHTHTNKILMS